LGEVLSRLRKHYGNPRVIITESGCADPLSKTAPAVQNDSFSDQLPAPTFAGVKAAMRQDRLLRAISRGRSSTTGNGTTASQPNWPGQQAEPGGARVPKASYAWFKALAQSGLLADGE